jgi:uncharacterized membrane protein
MSSKNMLRLFSKPQPDPVSVDDVLTVDELEFLEKYPDGIEAPDSSLQKYIQLTKGKRDKIFIVSDTISNITSRHYSVITFLCAVILWHILNLPGTQLLLASIWPQLADSSFIMFDPFPHPLLGFIMSFLGAILANIILISSRVNSDRDRAKLELDLGLALKSEIKNNLLMEKLDLLLDNQSALVPKVALTVKQNTEALEKITIKLDALDLSKKLRKPKI